MAVSLYTIGPDSNVASLGRPDAVMPPEKHLDMPTQSLRHWSASQERKPLADHPRTKTRLARLFVFGGGLLLTAYGTHELYQAASVRRTPGLQRALAPRS